MVLRASDCTVGMLIALVAAIEQIELRQRQLCSCCRCLYWMALAPFRACTDPVARWLERLMSQEVFYDKPIDLRVRGG